MKTLTLKGRCVVPGHAEGEALVTQQPLSFFGGVDAKSGLIIDRTHELKGESVAGRVLVFPYGKGSTVGSYVLYGLAKCGKAPCAVINNETEMIIASGCALARIPLIDRLSRDPSKTILTGDHVKITPTGVVQIRRL